MKVKTFDIGIATIYRWIKKNKNGCIVPSKRTNYSSKVDQKPLEDYVKTNPDRYHSRVVR